MTKTVQADLAYLRPPVDMEPYELSAFAALRSFIPDYYRDGRDDTVWGLHLRGVAAMLARVNWKMQYNLVSRDPKYLNPADVLRQYGGPLELSRSYPGASQRDLDFSAMVQELLVAYRQGCRVSAIQDVLTAYTAQDITVVELFKKIGTTATAADRNALQVAFGLATTESQIVADPARARTLVTDLYTAIDLAKPAHVGINLTGVYVEKPDQVPLEVTDNLTIRMSLADGDPNNIMLFQAHDPTRSIAQDPKTGVGPNLLTLTYQWYQLLDGVPQPLHGEVFNALTFASATSAAEGLYCVKVTDPNLGTLWSPVVSLMVYPVGTTLPRAQDSTEAVMPSTGTLAFQVPPFSQVVHDGALARFSVIVSSQIQAGNLSPYLNRVWEVTGDKLVGLDLE